MTPAAVTLDTTAQPARFEKRHCSTKSGSAASRSDTERNGFWVQNSSGGGNITKSIWASRSNPQ